MNNASAKSHKCIIQNAGQIVQVVSNGEEYVRGLPDLTKNNLSILNCKEADPLIIISIKYLKLLN